MSRKNRIISAIRQIAAFLKVYELGDPPQAKIHDFLANFVSIRVEVSETQQHLYRAPTG